MGAAAKFDGKFSSGSTEGLTWLSPSHFYKLSSIPWIFLETLHKDKTEIFFFFLKTKVTHRRNTSYRPNKAEAERYDEAFPFNGSWHPIRFVKNCSEIKWQMSTVYCGIMVLNEKVSLTLLKKTSNIATQWLTSDQHKTDFYIYCFYHSSQKIYFLKRPWGSNTSLVHSEKWRCPDNNDAHLFRNLKEIIEILEKTYQAVAPALPLSSAFSAKHRTMFMRLVTANLSHH